MDLKQSIFREYQDEEGEGETGAGRRSFLIKTKKCGSLRSFLRLHSFCSFGIFHSFYSFQNFPLKTP